VSTAPHMQGRRPDGLNTNFSAGATYHDPSYCVIARYGCGVSGAPMQDPGSTQSIAAMNYDPTVTVETVCYWPRPGCLNPAASNFGCENRDYTTPCSSSNQNVTVHSSAACVYAWELAPAPVPPPSPGHPASVEVVVTYVIKVAFTVYSTVEYFTPAVREAALNAFKTAIKAWSLNITLTVTSGSVNLEYTFETTDQTESESFERNVSAAVGSTTASAQAALGDAIGVQMLSGASVVRSTTTTYTPASNDASFSNSADGSNSPGVSIGAACGGVGLLLLAAWCIRFRNRNRRLSPDKRYPPTTPVVGVSARVQPE